MGETLKGQCLCGKVSLTATPRDRHVNACHCTMCRRWSAGPFMAFDAENVTFDDDDAVSVYDSSDWAERLFCNKCGTSIAYRLKDNSVCGVAAGLFKETDAFAFGMQFFIDEKPENYSFSQVSKVMTGAEAKAMFSSEDACP